MRDYTEISKWLRNCADINGGCTTCPMIGKTCCVMTLQGNAADAIEELLAENKAIKQSNDVLSCDKYGLVTENYMISDKGWSVGYHVTHWMPLPAQPKGVE